MIKANNCSALSNSNNTKLERIIFDKRKTSKYNEEANEKEGFFASNVNRKSSEQFTKEIMY